MEVIVWPDLVGPWPAPQPAALAEVAPGGVVQPEDDPPREAPEAERDPHRRPPGEQQAPVNPMGAR
jgi:hypothetical protein